MKNIQNSSSSNYNVHWGSYSGKHRASKSSQSESSSSNNDRSLSSKTKSLASSSSADKFTTSSSSTSYNSKLSEHETRSKSICSGTSEKKKDYRSKSYSGSNSGAQSCNENKVDHPFRSQRKKALPMIPEMAKNFFNYPYASPGASMVGDTYPRSCRSVEIVPGWQEGGCGVTCIAMVTGLSYQECREKAMMSGNYHPAMGMEMSGICETLQSLGAKAQMKHFNSWNDLPDLAIVGVWVGGGGHAVVFKRKNGKGYIFDRNATVPLSPERFTLMDNQCVYVAKN